MEGVCGKLIDRIFTQPATEIADRRAVSPMVLPDTKALPLGKPMGGNTRRPFPGLGWLGFVPPPPLRQQQRLARDWTEIELRKRWRSRGGCVLPAGGRGGGKSDFCPARRGDQRNRLR